MEGTSKVTCEGKGEGSCEGRKALLEEDAHPRALKEVARRARGGLPQQRRRRQHLERGHTHDRLEEVGVPAICGRCSLRDQGARVLASRRGVKKKGVSGGACPMLSSFSRRPISSVTNVCDEIVEGVNSSFSRVRGWFIE